MNISSVVENNLCVSCGLCAGVCPKKCISSIFTAGSYFPTVDENSCVNCGICHKVCPGKGADYVTLYKGRFPNIFFGWAVKCFAAQTKDKKILSQSTSGGALTTLIRNLLRDKIYDAAFLVDTYNHDT
ncbi:MAG: 4Fe-4S binding protein [Selenomonadaceae bacterium]|nr:4Fe-4S binding protein [Selenomonadaceae bacterium]